MPVSEADDPVVVDQEAEDGLGTGFALKLIGIISGIAILVFIGMLIFFRAIYAWGFIGAFLALAVVLLAYGWIHDRRNPRLPRV